LGRLTTVEIYGSPEAARTGEALYDWLRIEMFGTRSERNDDHRKRDTSGRPESSWNRFGTILESGSLAVGQGYDFQA